MTLAKRIIPCLDVDNGKVVKGINFTNLRRAGDPVELARRYSEEGADELVFLDITASSEKRRILKHVVRKIASEIDIPFTVGGGIQDVADARLILCNGADKVSINTAAVKEPSKLSELASIFGQQCVVVAIDAKRRYTRRKDRIADDCRQELWFETYIYGGRKPTGLDSVEWAQKAADLGAGEILLTSMDRDGTEDGFDLELTRTVSEKVRIPVIASGGAGKPEHFLAAFSEGKADAALAASVFHYDKYPISTVKRFLKANGVVTRL